MTDYETVFERFREFLDEDAEIVLGDEVLTPAAVHGAPESFHAPMVAEFRLPEGPNSDEDNP